MKLFRSHIIKNFESNIDSILGEILLVGVGGDDSSKLSTTGTILEIAKCTFRVVSRAPSVLSRVSGYISEFRIITEGSSEINLSLWEVRK